MSDETTMPFDFSNGGTPSIIKVIGVGGGGGNAVNHMYREGIHDVTFRKHAQRWMQNGIHHGWNGWRNRYRSRSDYRQNG